MTGDILGFLIGSVLGIWVVSLVVSGIRNGRLRHNRIKPRAPDSTSFRTHPFRFLFVALIFLMISCVLLFFAFQRGTSIWQRLVA